jgi:hypothetical protein
VDLRRNIGAHNLAVAYAFVEVDSIHGRETVLRCGSDDGIKVWLNGTVVHEFDGARAYEAGGDEVSIFLKEGTNRLLVKVTNVDGPWGFSVSIPRQLLSRGSPARLWCRCEGRVRRRSRTRRSHPRPAHGRTNPPAAAP